MLCEVNFFNSFNQIWSRVCDACQAIRKIDTSPLFTDYLTFSKQFQKRHKAKEVANTNYYSSESASEEDSDPEQAQRDKEMQKNLALLAKTGTEDTHQGITMTISSTAVWESRTMTVAGVGNSRQSVVATGLGYSAFNLQGGYGHYAKECRKPKRLNLARGHDEEIDEQELEAHYRLLAKESGPWLTWRIQFYWPALGTGQNHDESKVSDN
ncbi:hypothetical protein Tco_1157149 [Tanacetum coccineum]